MMFEKIEAMSIAFEFRNKYTIARVPQSYVSAEDFALELVYKLWVYVAEKSNVEYSKVVLIAISQNGKIVVFCENNRYRDWLYRYFRQPSVGYAQFYDNVSPEHIIEKLEMLLH